MLYHIIVITNTHINPFYSGIVHKALLLTRYSAIDCCLFAVAGVEAVRKVVFLISKVMFLNFALHSVLDFSFCMKPDVMNFLQILSSDDGQYFFTFSK